MAKKNDISADTLKELVKTHGDGLVTGYVRYKKVKACNGFKDAEDKASIKLSHIVAGRRLENNRYAAVIRFKAIFFVILFLCMLPVATLWRRDIPANVRESETSSIPVNLNTMDIPGYSDISMSKNSDGIILFNPENNPCGLEFYIYSGDKLVFKSGVLVPGKEERADIYNKFEPGIYEIQIITVGVTEDNEKLNSVSQIIKLEIKEE